MPSAINANLPADGTDAHKGDLRTNLGHAKDEISAIQALLAGGLTPTNFFNNTGGGFLGFAMGGGAPELRFLSRSAAKAISHDAAGTSSFPDFTAGGVDMAVRIFGTLSANRNLIINPPVNAADQAYAAVYIDGVSQASFQITCFPSGLTSFNPKTNVIYGLRWNGSAYQDWGSWPKGDFQTAVQAIIGQATGFWPHEVRSGNAITIDATADRKILEATHTAANTTVTFSAALPIGSEGKLIRNVGTRLLICQFGSGASQVLPQDVASNEAFTLIADHIRWRVLDNAGSAARYLIEIETGRHLNNTTLPAALLPEHSSAIFRVNSSGTTTLPAGTTLRRGFVCTVVNPPGSGFSRTLQGQSGSLVLAAGQTASLSVLDNGALVVSSGANQAL